ncbi:hypothetical protein PMIN07_007849 [Paraphaeosphaeria minitans]
MDQLYPDVSLTSLAKPKFNMADAMRAALRSLSATPKSTQEHEMRASYDAINARIDDRLVAQGYMRTKLPPLLRIFQGNNNVGSFAAMVEFACDPRQRLVNWRNCSEHKDRLATLDLSDPEAVFRKMEAEARGILPAGGNKNSAMAESAVITDSGSQQPRQAASTNILHPDFAQDRSTTASPPTLLSPYSTPVQQPTKIANVPSSSPTQSWARTSSPYAEKAAVKNVVNPPSPSSSSCRSGSAQEHLQERRAQMMQGHMPHLSTNMLQPPTNGANYSSPYLNRNMASHAVTGYGQVPPPESADVRSIPHSAPIAVMSNHEAIQQQRQTPYARSESFNGAKDNHFTTSKTRQPTQQHNHSPFGNSLTSRPARQTEMTPQSQRQNRYTPIYNNSRSGPAYQPGKQAQPQQQNGYKPVGNGSISKPVDRPSTQPQPQQRNSKPVMKPFAEFRAAVDRQQPPELHMSESGDRDEQVRQHMPGTTKPQQPASISIKVPHQVQPGQQGILVPSGYRSTTLNKRHHSELSESATVQSTIKQPPHKKKTTTPNYAGSNRPDTYAAAATSIPQARTKTKEELEYQQQIAAWEKYKAEKEEQDLKEAERKKRLKAELTAEMRKGDEVLTYRYREYLEVHPLPKDERPNGYYLSFLANQVVEERDQTEGAMAVRYAKEKFWNQWKIKDKLTVIELLREKAKKQDHGMVADMKTGGYLITADDIQAIRRTAPLYAAPEFPLPEIEE